MSKSQKLDDIYQFFKPLPSEEISYFCQQQSDRENVIASINLI
jgi:hypothetical protein